MKAYLYALLCAALFVFAPQVQAESATPQASGPVPNKPAQVKDRVTAISVVHEGTDSIGARLSSRLKESFNSSSLFRLTEADGAKMKLLITTAPEFPSRPGVGSVYSICWVFSQSDTYLPFLLSRECGTVCAEDVESLVAKLVERSDGVAVKYTSLWK